MGQRRPRTPHFVSAQDVAEENENEEKKSLRAPADARGHYGTKRDIEHLESVRVRKNQHDEGQRFVRFRNERLERLEQPLTPGEQWREIFGGDLTLGQPSVSLPGPWQVSAFALLGVVVVLSAIFLHMVAENSDADRHHTPYNNYRRRQRHARRMYKTRKKKTDEWSDDEEEIHNNRSDHSDAVAATALVVTHMYPYQHEQVTTGLAGQEHRHRRTSYSEPDTPPRGGPAAVSGRNNNYHFPVNAKYRSPSANVMNVDGVHRRGISPGNSISSKKCGGQSPGAVLHPTASIGGYSSSGTIPSSDHSRRGNNVPLSGRLRFPSTPEGKDVVLSPGLSSNLAARHSSALTTPSRDAEQPALQPQFFGGPRELGARPLNASNFPSFASAADAESVDGYSGRDDPRQRGAFGDVSHSPSSLHDFLLTASGRRYDSLGSQHHLHESHHQSLLLSPGNYEAETPQVGNVGRRLMSLENNSTPALPYLPSGLQPTANRSSSVVIPFIPALGLSSRVSLDDSVASTLPLPYAASRPPRSVLLDELRIVQMETGNSTQWDVRRDGSETTDALSPSYAKEGTVTCVERDRGGLTDHQDDDDFSESGSDIPIPSGDPRGGIVHKRDDLTKDTDACKSLQSNIDFEDLALKEVIGGGGFGQVWRATWFGTPVAVKVLTGSAQNTHIAKAILEEFKAEINLLKGMRHPNICLYMGACVKPPNRAIVTELAANGSVWDALRLPLSPPYVAVDGTSRDAWPIELYVPGEHGAPPSDVGPSRISAPTPPRGTWPWQLVKRVASGAARGMAYLHHGHPPILHRDLKSANLLLDDAYTVKVCDFGLSRLKAQARSMTGNCGTVQWMAPEVLANMDYDEKADVFSYGIILWELLSRECPYEGMTAIQCALAVLNRDKRPDIPKWCPPAFHALIKACVKKDPAERPDFSRVIQTLDVMEG